MSEQKSDSNSFSFHMHDISYTYKLGLLQVRIHDIRCSPASGLVVARRSKAVTERPPDGLTDGRTETPSYRVAYSQLKRIILKSQNLHFPFRTKIKRSIQGCGDA